MEVVELVAGQKKSAFSITVKDSKAEIINVLKETTIGSGKVFLLCPHAIDFTKNQKEIIS